MGAFLNKKYFKDQDGMLNPLPLFREKKNYKTSAFPVK